MARWSVLSIRLTVQTETYEVGTVADNFTLKTSIANKWWNIHIKQKVTLVTSNNLTCCSCEREREEFI